MKEFTSTIMIPLSTAVYAALEYLNHTDVAVSYDIRSEIPQKRGMGSSAAISIAAIRAVFDYFERALSTWRRLKFW